ncbi:MAG: Crp/Fnr family transcriptional regulator [Methylocystaceae bacterium]|nr:MAG: Crp/Fnr family transcriptional regulator [Methylocystaceae bacterium]
MNENAVLRRPPAEKYDPFAGMDALATPIRRRRGEIVHDGERGSRYLYRVAAGAARRCALQADGRRRILDLLFPGDFFGFGENGETATTIEALVDGTIVLRYPRREIEALADADPPTARAIRGMAFATISRLETQISLLGRVNAVEKVGAFLLALEERQNAGGDRLTLPVSRCDIGDFLALSPETVSRSLSSLERRGAISFAAPRDVDIVDRIALRERIVKRERARPARVVRKRKRKPPR